MRFSKMVFVGGILLGIFSFGYADARGISSKERKMIDDSMKFLKIAGFDLTVALSIKNSLINTLKFGEKIDDKTLITGVQVDGKEATVGDIKKTAKKGAKKKEEELKKVAKQYNQIKKNADKDGRDVFPYLFKQGNKLCKELKILGGDIPTIPILNADGSTTDKPVCV